MWRRDTKFLLKVALAALFLLFGGGGCGGGSSTTMSETTSIRFAGTIQAEDGSARSNVEVTLVNNPLEVVTVTTDQTGFFELETEIEKPDTEFAAEFLIEDEESLSNRLVIPSIPASARTVNLVAKAKPAGTEAELVSVSFGDTAPEDSEGSKGEGGRSGRGGSDNGESEPAPTPIAERSPNSEPPVPPTPSNTPGDDPTQTPEATPTPENTPEPPLPIPTPPTLPALPAAPLIQEAIIAGSNSELTWQKAPNAEGYVIYRSFTEQGSYQAIGAVDGATLNFVDPKALSAGTFAYYRVSSVIGEVEGEPSEPILARPMADFNHDGCVDLEDKSMIDPYIADAKYNQDVDYNGDGRVDAADAVIFTAWYSSGWCAQPKDPDTGSNSGSNPRTPRPTPGLPTAG